MKWLVVVMLVTGCGAPAVGGDDDPLPDDGGNDGANGDGPPSGNGGVFDPAVLRVDVEIDYETGQPPYTGPILGFGDTFDLTVNNIGRLFAGKKTLTIPTVTADMQDIGAVADEELTVGDLLALATTHRAQHDAAGVKTYYIVFVSGHYADGSGVQTGVLGVSIGNTGVVAMFKDVIRSTGIVGVPNLVRFVEQTTLTHELGHAIGLVDNGVAMVANHKDAAHGAHCTNDKCVMFWLNEGANDAAEFASTSVLASDTILFDAGCLADVDALTGGL